MLAVYFGPANGASFGQHKFEVAGTDIIIASAL